MAAPLWTAVYGIVLGTGKELAVLGSLGALESTHHCLSHQRSEIWVFAVSLLSASPTRIAEYVHVGSPHRKAVESRCGDTILILFVPLGSCLVGSHGEYTLHQWHVERSRHTNRFGEHSDIALVGKSMQSLTPPTEWLDAESGDGWRFVAHQVGLLFEGKARRKVNCSFVSRKVGVLIQPLLSRNTAAGHHRHGEK